MVTELRERTRRAVRSEVLGVALDLFLRQGYEATTVEQISEAAGLSRRSFFRYFTTKDELIGAALAESGRGVAETLRRRPAGETPWFALRRAMDPLVEQMTTQPQALEMTRMMLEGVALRATHEHKQVRWRTALSQALAPRLTDVPVQDGRALVADALAGSALACLGAAEVAWVAQGDRSALGALLDGAMGAVAPVT